jgi:fructose-specific component phosphotransferase system IIB-like protein
MASANLDTQLGDLPTNAELATALGTADDATLAAIAALNDISATDVWAAAARTLTAGTNIQLPANSLDLVLVDGKTLPAALQIIGAVVAGEISGAGTATEVFLGLDGSTTRVTVTADASGNRTAVVYA